MNHKNLIPLVLFCAVFLVFSIYFVKVVNTNQTLEPNSIAKTVKRAIDEKQLGSPVPLVADTEVREPIKRFVNYSWLNVREKPTLASSVVEKIYQGDEVLVLSFPTASWAYIKTSSDQKGYVANRYLSDQPVRAEELDIPVSEDEEPDDQELVSTASSPEPAVRSDVYELPIITYHHILNDVEHYSASSVLPEVNFFAQLDYLVGHGFKTSTFSDLRDLTQGKKSPEKAVILVFNGGYADAYVASQHLNGKGMKGVFFITTDKIGKEGYLDWRQVKKMKSWGMEIGSRGVNGANLAQSSEFYLRDEVIRSKQLIEEQLGESILSFSYPEGAYNQDIAKVVQEAGYVFAVTSDSGSRYGSRQFFTLPQLRIFFPAGANQLRVWLGE